jgi:hypothetical protein
MSFAGYVELKEEMGSDYKVLVWNPEWKSTWKT